MRVEKREAGAGILPHYLVHSSGQTGKALTLCTTTYNCVPVVVEVVARRVKVQQEGGSLQPFMGSDLGLC